MAYCKIHLYSLLLESDLPEDPYLAHDLERYFPPPLPERYARKMRSHRLRREIIVTVVANQLVDRAGSTFVFRLHEETGAAPSILARGYAVAREVFDMRSFWTAVEELDNTIEAQTQLAMLIEARRLVERATRWLVRANPRAINIALTTHHYEPGAKMLAAALPGVLEGAERDNVQAHADALVSAGVPAALARQVAGMPALLSTFDIVEVAAATAEDPETVMQTYFHLGSRLELNWLREQILDLPRANRWQALARAALRDDLYSLHRALTQEVLGAGAPRRRQLGRDRSVVAPQRRCDRALPGHACRHQGLADVRHDDAAGRAAGGSQLDPRRNACRRADRRGVGHPRRLNVRTPAPRGSAAPSLWRDPATPAARGPPRAAGRPSGRSPRD